MYAAPFSTSLSVQFCLLRATEGCNWLTELLAQTSLPNSPYLVSVISSEIVRGPPDEAFVVMELCTGMPLVLVPLSALDVCDFLLPSFPPCG